MKLPTPAKAAASRIGDDRRESASRYDFIRQKEKGSPPVAATSSTSQPDGRADTPTHPTPKRFYRFRAWYRYSRLRLVAEEICSFPRRIVTALRLPHLRWGYSIPAYPNDPCRESLALGNTFLHACNNGIQELARDNPWAGRLDLEMAAEAFLAGAIWASGNPCSCKGDTSKE